ncbi:hypothetical protein BBJ41_14545 [Burkholderia stabilis]|uniref:Uncharacterized protein n=1 Tax=Burkholderia contaminans TaxID=488447 RepID=A0A250LKS1_9BURK|nr:hypothetical protein BBJ41_14545 [Burkholderia stabilis]BBA45168.1 hypothetical protein BCCH1_76790 [Burkholderia contaminans]
MGLVGIDEDTEFFFLKHWIYEWLKYPARSPITLPVRAPIRVPPLSKGVLVHNVSVLADVPDMLV